MFYTFRPNGLCSRYLESIGIDRVWLAAVRLRKPHSIPKKTFFFKRTSKQLQENNLFEYANVYDNYVGLTSSKDTSIQTKDQYTILPFDK